MNNSTTTPRQAGAHRYFYWRTYVLIILAIIVLVVGVWQNLQMKKEVREHNLEMVVCSTSTFAQSLSLAAVAPLLAPADSAPHQWTTQSLTGAFHELVQSMPLVDNIYLVIRHGNEYRCGPLACTMQHDALPHSSAPIQPSAELLSAFEGYQSVATTATVRQRYLQVLLPFVHPESGEVPFVLVAESSPKHWQRQYLQANYATIAAMVSLLLLLLGLWLLLRVRGKKHQGHATTFSYRFEVALAIAVVMIMALALAWRLHQSEVMQRERLLCAIMQKHYMQALRIEMWQIWQRINMLQIVGQTNGRITQANLTMSIEQGGVDKAVVATYWAPEVKAEHLAEHEARARAELGLEDYRVWPDTIAAQPNNDIRCYFPALYTVAAADYSVKPGFDFASDRGHQQAIQCAIKTGALQSSPPQRLGPDADAPYVVYLYKTVQTRSERGLLIRVVNLSGSLQRVFAQPQATQLGAITHVAVYHLDQQQPPTCVYTNAPDPASDALKTCCFKGGAKHIPEFLVSMQFFGKVYNLHFRATSAWLAYHPLRQGGVVLMGGTGLAVLLGLLLMLYMRQHDYLREQIHRKTQELKQERDNVNATNHELQGTIAQLRQTYEKLEYEQNLLKALLVNMPERIFFKDLQLRYIKVSHEQARFLNIDSPEGAVGRTLVELCPGEVSNQTEQRERQIIESRRSLLGHISRVEDGAGQVHWELLSQSPLYARDGTLLGLMSVGRDITDEMELQMHLQHTAKMEAMGRLAGGIAHDFNNLLQSILGYTELLMLGLDESQPYHNELHQIKQAAQRAANLTRQLLTFGSKHQTIMQDVDLNLVISDTLHMIKRLVGAAVNVELKLEERLASVLADSNQIEQILLNLAANARDAMPGGGDLVISTNWYVLRESERTPNVDAQPGNYIRMSVADSGSGISADIGQRIFEPFFTTKERGKGTGLGLSITYGIVKRSGGWVEVGNHAQGGAIISLFFPISDLSFWNERVAEKTQPVELGIMSGLGKTILFLESENEIRQFAVLMMRSAGYRVLECEDVQGAKAILGNQDEQVDLLFSDIMLSDKSGLELASEVRAQMPYLPILLCSGLAADTIDWKLIRQHEVTFLPKPYTAAKLLALLKQLVVTKNRF